MKWDSCSFILVQIHHLLICDYEVQNWIKTEEDVPHVLFYSGLIISVWVRRMKKLIILFIKVALSCHGKRNNLGAKERDSRREKWWEVMISRWPLYCIFLSHGAPRQLVPAPTSSFMSWGHCYFFCREVISLAVSLLLLPWSYSFCREVFFFFRESFSFYREVFFFRSESFLFAVRFFFLPRVFFLFREVISFAVTVPTVCTHSSFAHTWNKDDRFTKTNWCSEILGLALIENLFFILIFISHSLIVRWSWFFM